MLLNIFVCGLRGVDARLHYGRWRDYSLLSVEVIKKVNKQTKNNFANACSGNKLLESLRSFLKQGHNPGANFLILPSFYLIAVPLIPRFLSVI